MNGSILIPEKFKLNGKTIQVIIDNDYCKDNKCMGEADFTLNIITLCDEYGGKKVNKRSKEQIFYHELIHHILNAMNLEKLKYNELFVDMFADKLIEYERSKR
jgi:hypothetical protein